VNVLSLFDGKSGAMAALQAIGIKPTNYYACEIDKYAQAVSRYHYPEIIRLGDVTKVTGSDLPKIDLLVAGFPCQAFSMAGKQLNFEDPRGKLFFEVIRLIKELQPTYFLLENVCMKKEYEEQINKLVGVPPVMINSALLSAQNRKRLYWANFPITQPEDKRILLKDIIDNAQTEKDKSYCIDANYFKGASFKQYQTKCRRQLVNSCIQVGVTKETKHNSITCRVYALESKSPTLTTCSTGGCQEKKITENNITWRKLTPVECERLQTVPDEYTLNGIDENGKQITISNSQRYKMLGNGFTIDVISNILKGIKV
jgi:DNA-cytosine methyltransferase